MDDSIQSWRESSHCAIELEQPDPREFETFAVRGYERAFMWQP